MQIESKLKQLRIKWKNHPELRDIIERQVVALKYSQQPYKFKNEAETEKLVESVIDNLM